MFRFIHTCLTKFSPRDFREMVACSRLMEWSGVILNSWIVEHERGLTIRCVYVLSLDFGERLRSRSAGVAHGNFSLDKKSVSVILTSIFSIKSSISLQSMGRSSSSGASSYCRCAMVIIHRDDGNCCNCTKVSRSPSSDTPARLILYFPSIYIAI